MGQQQLLLIILVTIIVGIATVVAINTFSSAADNANIDAVRQDMVALASDAQAYYMKPDMMEGGGNSFSDITIEDLNCPGDLSGTGENAECSNENGVYTITSTADGEFTLQGDPASSDDAADNLTATVLPDDVTFTN